METELIDRFASTLPLLMHKIMELDVVRYVELYAHAQEIGSLGKLQTACDSFGFVFIFDAFSQAVFDRRPH